MGRVHIYATIEAFLKRPRHAYKHTLTRLARSTLNELQQNQHDKASLVCVRVQSPSGLALVPCAFGYGRPKWPITMLNHTDIPGTEKCFYYLFFWHPMLVRPAMKRLFCVKAKNSLILNITTQRSLCHAKMANNSKSITQCSMFV